MDNVEISIPRSSSSSFSIRKCRKVIITGGVAVGKSSIVNVVCEELTRNGKKWILVPEYLDVKDDGLEMLNKYFENKISVYEFQTYILNYYEWYLKNVKVSDDDIIIFERSIDDGITYVLGPAPLTHPRWSTLLFRSFTTAHHGRGCGEDGASVTGALSDCLGIGEI